MEGSALLLLCYGYALRQSTESAKLPGHEVIFNSRPGHLRG